MEPAMTIRSGEISGATMSVRLIAEPAGVVPRLGAGLARHLPSSTILVLSMSLTSSAATIHVPGDQPTIQAGIDAAAPGDEVLVAPGHYFEVISLKSEIAVRGAGGAGATWIEGDGSATMVICDGMSDAIFEGFTITGGGGTDVDGELVGGGILCVGSSLLIQNLVIRDCNLFPGWYQGSKGAGIACLQGSAPEIRSVRVENCRARGECEDCLVAGDEYGGGGGLYCDAESSPLVIECTIVGNQAGDDGGGGILSRSPSLIVESTLFESNRATGAGGGGFLGEGTVVACSFVDNSAFGRTGGAGGGLLARDRVMIVDCLFVGNVTGAGRGGAVCVSGSDVQIRRSTISFNEANLGSGVYVGVFADTGPTLDRNIITTNGSGVAGFGVYGQSGSPPAVIQCNDIWGNRGGEYGGSIPDQTGMRGNISLDPLFCGSEMRDFTLRAGSPCVPGQHPDGVECGLIGAFGEGCGTVSVEAASWTEVKAKYR